MNDPRREPKWLTDAFESEKRGEHVLIPINKSARDNLKITRAIQKKKK